MTMNPVVKKDWLRALRSGEYTQTRRVLHDRDEGHCCLGVLCDIAAREGVVKAEDTTDRASEYFIDGKDRNITVYGEERAESFLPFEVRQWAGLDECPEVPRGEGMEIRDTAFVREYMEENNLKPPPVALYSLNDDYKFTFEQIADLIEKHF